MNERDTPEPVPAAPVAANAVPARSGRVLLALAAAGLVAGGLESLLMRAQLARAGATLVPPAIYHQLLTLHGVSMLFLCVLPAAMGMFLLLGPERLGSGTTAFPVLSAFAARLWVAGAVVLHAGLLLGGTSGAGMLGNASMTSLEWASRDTVYRGLLTFRANGVDWWATGMALVAFAASLVALEIVASVAFKRGAGKKLTELTPFAWNSLVAGVLGLVAYPALFAGLVLLQRDRLLDGNLFVPESGADPSLWPRLTALLGHPQVAMLLLPAMGLAGEVVASAAGRPLHGRGLLRAGSLVLGLAGLLAWFAQATSAGAAYAQALLPVAGSLMALVASMAVFHWLGTLWGRPVAASPALLFVLGMAALVMTGAWSTLPLALQSSAVRQVGTYFGVAHAHEMLFGGVLLGLVAGLYHTAPRLLGRLPDARTGQLHFALTFVGAFATFLPMHALGLAGMPRRIHTYDASMGWGTLNAIASAGALVLLGSGVVFALALLRAKPVAAGAPGAAAGAGVTGLTLVAAGLATLAAATLLGWFAALAGVLLLGAGVWRRMGERS